ncbi:hypothetical protein [Luteitalea sp.]|uniref:hypothetical protein n=1 Tax=Luteitalea sp. TaxID=2004800 RepID=UPI0025BEE224|nr:hypothetical protein [Luteitalea sp.]
MVRWAGMRVLRLVVALTWVWLAGLTVAALIGFDVRRHNFEAAGLAFGVALSILMLVAMSADEAPCARPRVPRLTIVAVVVVALVAFGWSLSLGPLSDDFALVQWARTRDFVPAEWPYMRPLPLALWAGITSAGGDWATLHAVNVLGHACNASLVAVLGSAWLGTRAALTAGLVYALFPASAEAVAWAAGVFDVLATTCALSAVLVGVHRPPSPSSAVAVAALTFAGLLCKESAIAIPALILVSNVVMTRRWSARGLVTLGSSAAVCVGYLFLRLAASSSVTDHLSNWPTGRRAWKDVLVRPFAGVAVPIRTDGGVPLSAYVAVASLLLLLSLAAVASSRRNRAASPIGAGYLGGVAWIIAAAAPLLLSFYVAPNLEGSRYLYLPAVGYALVVAAAASASCHPTSRAVGHACVAILLVTFAVSGNIERQHWRAGAALRDSLLAEAQRAAAEDACSEMEIVDAPDNLRGVFVFRVGVQQAIRPLLTPRTPPRTCRLRWTGERLAALPASVDPK